MSLAENFYRLYSFEIFHSTYGTFSKTFFNMLIFKSLQHNASYFSLFQYHKTFSNVTPNKASGSILLSQFHRPIKMKLKEFHQLIGTFSYPITENNNSHSCKPYKRSPFTPCLVLTTNENCKKNFWQAKVYTKILLYFSIKKSDFWTKKICKLLRALGLWQLIAFERRFF